MANSYGTKQSWKVLVFLLGILAVACGGNSQQDLSTAAELETEQAAAVSTIDAAAEVTDEEPASDAQPDSSEVDDAFAAMEESLDGLDDAVDDLEPEAVATTSTVVEAPETPGAGEAADPATTAGSTDPDASLEDLQAALVNIIGATDDVAAVTRSLGQFPAGVPTLPDASIFELQNELRLANDNSSITHSTRVGYWTSASAADAFGFYETELAALGYDVLDKASQEGGDGATAAIIRTSVADEGSLSGRTLEVQIRTGDFDGTKVAFWYQAVDANADQALPYVSWTSSSPLPNTGELRSVKLVLTPIGDPPFPRTFRAFSSGLFLFEGVDEVTLRSQIGETIDSGGEYSLTGSLDAFRVGLSSPRFSNVGVTIQSGGTESSADLAGSWDIPNE